MTDTAIAWTPDAAKMRDQLYDQDWDWGFTVQRRATILAAKRCLKEGVPVKVKVADVLAARLAAGDVFVEEAGEVE